MSSAARWSYTATATLWPFQTRDGWGGGATYGPAETFACDYRQDDQTMRDDAGLEFVSRLTLYTERGDLKRGDRVLLGDASDVVDPIAAGAREVRGVTRYGDTLERKADDFVIGTV